MCLCPVRFLVFGCEVSWTQVHHTVDSVPHVASPTSKAGSYIGLISQPTHGTVVSSRGGA